MISTAVRPQRSVIGVGGETCKAWEFDYHRTTFYIQETETGYAVVEETMPRGAWKPVQPERLQLVISEFEHAKSRQPRIAWR